MNRAIVVVVIQILHIEETEYHYSTLSPPPQPSLHTTRILFFPLKMGLAFFFCGTLSLCIFARHMYLMKVF